MVRFYQAAGSGASNLALRSVSERCAKSIGGAVSVLEAWGAVGERADALPGKQKRCEGVSFEFEFSGQMQYLFAVDLQGASSLRMLARPEIKAVVSPKGTPHLNGQEAFPGGASRYSLVFSLAPFQCG